MIEQMNYNVGEESGLDRAFSILLLYVIDKL